MLKRALFFTFLFIFGVYGSDIRNLASNSDNCAQYAYLDSQGNLNDNDCAGCKKVCKICDPGYYVNEKYNCRKLPRNCAEADKTGKCTKCEDGYYFDKDNICQKYPKNCIKVD